MASVNFYLKGATSEKHIEELRNAGDTEFLNELLNKNIGIVPSRNTIRGDTGIIVLRKMPGCVN